MLMTLKKIIDSHNLKINGVIHIGAHQGDEVKSYVDSGITEIFLFEPVCRHFEALEQNVQNLNANIYAYNVALGSSTGMGKINININNRGQSSSLLKPKQHLIDHPWVLFEGTETIEIDILDNYNTLNANLINVDVQGYELEVFKGAKNTLEKIDYIITEVNRAEMYEKNVLIDELDEFLQQYKFKRIETIWPDTWFNWGDALYIKEK